MALSIDDVLFGGEEEETTEPAFAQVVASQSSPSTIQPEAPQAFDFQTSLDKLIDFETAGTRSPSIVNPTKGQSAKGLIQFTDGSAQDLGYRDSQDLVDRNPTFDGQMKNAVIPYLNQYNIQSEEDLYLAVFYPAAIGGDLDKPFPRNVQRVNPGIVTPRDYINKVNGAKGGAQSVNPIDAILFGEPAAEKTPQLASAGGSSIDEVLFGSPTDLPVTDPNVAPVQLADNNDIQLDTLGGTGLPPELADITPDNPIIPGEGELDKVLGAIFDKKIANAGDDSPFGREYAVDDGGRSRFITEQVEALSESDQQKAIEDTRAVLGQIKNEGVDGFVVSRLAAAGKGVSKALPLLDLALKKARENSGLDRESSAGAAIEQELPLEVVGAQMGTTVAMALGGGAALNNALTKVPALANNPLLRSAIVRTTISAGTSAGQQDWEKNFKESMKNTIQSGGAGLVSVVPEVILPANAWQLLGQPAIDLLYDGTVDALRGKDVGTADWWKQEMINLAMSEGFAIRDVASGNTFKVEQGQMRETLPNGVKKALSKTDAALSPEGWGEKLSGMFNEPRSFEVMKAEDIIQKTLAEGGVVTSKQQRDKTVPLRFEAEAEAGSKLPKQDTFPASELGSEVKKVVGGLEITGVTGARTTISEAEFVRRAQAEGLSQNQIDKVLTTPSEADRLKTGEPIDADIQTTIRTKPDKPSDQGKAGEAGTEPGGKIPELGDQEIGRIEADEAARTEDIESRIRESIPTEEDSGFLRLSEADQAKVIDDIEAKQKDDALRFIDDDQKAQGEQTKLEDAQGLIDLTKGVRNSMDSKSFGDSGDPHKRLESARWLKKGGKSVDQARIDFVADNREALLARGIDPDKVLTRPDEFVEFLDRIPTDADIASFKDSAGEAKTKAADTLDKLKIPGEVKPADIQKLAGTPLSELEQKFQTGVEPKKVDAEKAGQLLIRSRGLSSTTGSVGGVKQKKITSQTPFDNMRADVKKQTRFNMRKTADKWAGRIYDVNAGIKRKLAENSLGTQAAMKLDLSRGGSAEGKAQFDDAEKNVYKTIPHDTELLFNDYLTAKRTIEVQNLKGPEFKSPITVEQADKVLSDMESQDPQRFKSIEAAAKKYWATMLDQLKQKHAAGMLTDEGFKTLKENHKHYTPRQFIQFLDPEVGGLDSRGRKINVPDSGIKRLDKGSEEALQTNSRLLLGQVIGRTQSQIFKNNANKALLAYAEADANNGVGIKIEQPTRTTKAGEEVFGDVPNGMTRVSAMVDGKKTNMLIPDEMAQYWVQSDPIMNDEWARFVSTVSGSKVVKIMATGANPEFAMGNMPRDAALAWYSTTEYNPILPVALAQMAIDYKQVFKDAVSQKGSYRDYIKEGGGMDFMTQQAFASKKPWQTKTKNDEIIEQLGETFGWLGNFTERWTRLALRNRAIKNGISPEQATHIARTYIDFGQGGSWVKAADNGIPYLNAGVQGTRGIVRAHKRNPAVASFKAAQIMGLGFGLAAMNTYWNKEAWDEISDREKQTKWIITTPFTYKDENGDKRHFYFAISKDQGQRAFAAIGESMSNLMGGSNVEAESAKVAESVLDFINIDPANNIPPLASAVAAYEFNKDTWTRRDVYNGRSVKDKTLEQYPDTPEFWQSWGRITGKSPERSRAAFHKMIPENVYTDMVGGLWRQITNQMPEKAVNEMNRNMVDQLSNVPGVRKIFRQTWPVRTDNEELDKKIRKFGIETANDDNTPKTKRQLVKDVKDHEQSINDTRQRNDLEMKRLFINDIAKKDKRETDRKVTKLLDRVEKADGHAEWLRLSRMVTRFKLSQQGKKRNK